MIANRSNEVFVRLWNLITLGCVFMMLVAFLSIWGWRNGPQQASRTNEHFERSQSSKSPARYSGKPEPASPQVEAKRPNAIRRFISWVAGGFRRLFGRRPRGMIGVPPPILLNASTSSITLPCPEGTSSTVSCPTGTQVTLTAATAVPNTDDWLFTWAVDRGRLRGEGIRVIWDLTGVEEGTYVARLEVSDRHHLTANASTTVTIVRCSGCERRP
jgi:hypothetical protein